MSDLRVSLILQLKNLIGRGIGQVRGDLRGLKGEAQGLAGIKGPSSAGLDRYGRSAREASAAVRQFKRDALAIGGGKAAGGAGNGIIAGGGNVLKALGGIYVGRQALAGTLGQAISFEKAMAQVRKKVDAPDEAAFGRLEQTINRIAKDYGLARANVAELTAEAGAAGIAFDDLERFMRLTAKAAVAWDMSPGEASQKLAEIKTATQMTAGELEQLSEKINGLGDNSAAKERDIVEMFQRAGAAAKAAGVNFDVSLAALTAVRSTGLQPEVASRWFAAFTGGLRTIEEGSAKSKEGLKIIGLSAEQVARGMKRDALGTMLDIFERLQKSPEAATAAIKIFGKEWWDETSRAGQALPELRKQLEYLKSGKWSGSLDKTLGIELQTTANHLERLKSLAGEIGDRMGRWALPPINDAIERLISKYDELKERLEARKSPIQKPQRAHPKSMTDYFLEDPIWGYAGRAIFGEELTKDPARRQSLALHGAAADKQKLATKQAEEAAVLRVQAANAKSKEDRARLTIEAGKKEQDAAANQRAAEMDRTGAGRAAARDMTNIEAGSQHVPALTAEVRARNTELERRRSLTAELTAAEAELSRIKEAGATSGKLLKMDILQGRIDALKAKLGELPAEADKTGAAVKDKLTLDLTPQGAAAAQSFAAGLTAGSGAVSEAAASLRARVQASLGGVAPIGPVAPSPASAPAPAGGKSAARATTVHVAAINVHGVSDPDRAAKKAVGELANALRSSLGGAHHDGVA